MRWLRVYRPALEHAPVERASTGRGDQIDQQVTERLAEDEALRGELTDDAFAPIFAWVTSLIPDAARRAAPEPDPDEASEQLSDAARGLTRSLVHLVSGGDPEPVRDALKPPLLTADEASRARQAVPSGSLPGSSADERAASLIEALKAALAGTQRA